MSESTSREVSVRQCEGEGRAFGLSLSVPRSPVSRRDLRGRHVASVGPGWDRGVDGDREAGDVPADGLSPECYTGVPFGVVGRGLPGNSWQPLGRRKTGIWLTAASRIPQWGGAKPVPADRPLHQPMCVVRTQMCSLGCRW